MLRQSFRAGADMAICQPSHSMTAPEGVSDAGLSRSIRHRAEGRRPKASREGTRGGPVQAVWRLWGFDGAAGSVKDALAGIIGRGPGIAIGSRASLRLSTGRFQHARLCGAGFWRRWGDGEVAPEARSPSGRAV